MTERGNPCVRFPGPVACTWLVDQPGSTPAPPPGHSLSDRLLQGARCGLVGLDPVGEVFDVVGLGLEGRDESADARRPAVVVKAEFVFSEAVDHRSGQLAEHDVRLGPSLDVHAVESSELVTLRWPRLSGDRLDRPSSEGPRQSLKPREGCPSKPMQMPCPMRMPATVPRL